MVGLCLCVCVWVDDLVCACIPNLHLNADLTLNWTRIFFFFLVKNPYLPYTPKPLSTFLHSYEHFSTFLAEMHSERVIR